MKLIKLHIIDADTCGGLLNGLRVNFRSGEIDANKFSPLCLVGPNGAGKSQTLQIIAEIFQALFAHYLPEEEKGAPNQQIQFELEYQIFDPTGAVQSVRASRRKEGRKKPKLILEKLMSDYWVEEADLKKASELLPTKVIGYTSGENETLSIPFFVSRSGYADQVRSSALDKGKASLSIPDSRMLLIDYGTNLEVLIANLLLNPPKVRQHLIHEFKFEGIRSFRCIIQLKYGSSALKIVKLTEELNHYIQCLKSCSTCHTYNPRDHCYIFDFFIQEATYEAFSSFWKKGALELYSCFHKLAMLNDLVIPKKDRDAFKSGVEKRRFASRLPEPMERQKVFRFERIEFFSGSSDRCVDYVSLSDGEHQLTQILGTLCMVNFPNVLFLLDEPESHFNPRWRVEFISKIMSLPTPQVALGRESSRRAGSSVSRQDCLITTHSPFVPSDMDSDNVLIFSKNEETGKIKVRRPNIQTYGSTFDRILEECFGISPPMSDMPKNAIGKLLESNDVEEIKSAMSCFGDSLERIYLAERIRILESEKET
jgi:restriction system-associated AAA family ATPase